MRIIQTSIIVACTALLVAATAHQDAKTAAVERGEIVLTVRQTGRIDAATRMSLKADLEAFNGQLEVAEVVRDGGTVQKGETIITFDTEAIDRQIEDAAFAMADAQQSFEFAQTERDVLAEASQIRLERAEAAKRKAQHAFEVFDKYEGDQMLRRSELSVKQREHSLEDQREELEQLKSMYDDSSLASETKEIVIKRNERQIAMSEEYLQFARNDLIVMREYTYPDRKLDVENNLRWASLELEHAKLQTTMAAARKATEVDRARRSLADAEKKLRDLKRDRESFTIAAPRSGILTPIDLDPGDDVRGGQMIAEIIDPDALIVEFDASAADLRVLREGEEVTITPGGFPEVKLTRTVESIALVGKAQGAGTVFPVRIALESEDPMLRVGLDCTVSAERPLHDVLRVPKKAVKTENGRSTVRIIADGEPQAREVIIGASGNEYVQIVEGLREGDQVVIE